jgi:DegV family protein with EDD domain
LGNVRIVTDSTADLPKEIREQWEIEMVPLKVHFGDETFLDGVTIEASQFYEKLAKAKELPTTSQPAPSDFLDVYRKLAEQPGAEIISIHLSSAFSGTFQSAMLAKSMLENDADISIVDSKSASCGIGLLVVEAAKAAKAGKSKAECLEIVDRLRRSMQLYFLVDTLEYLHKGGRIGKAQALFGSLLNIKPILTIDDDGMVAPVEKVRGQKKAMARIVERIKEKHAGERVKLYIAHANALDTAQDIAALIEEQIRVEEIQYTYIGPVIGTHAGPGAVGVFVIPG